MKEGRVKLRTVKGNENVADHLTKPKSMAQVEEMLRNVGAEFVESSTGAGAGPSSSTECSSVACIRPDRLALNLAVIL